MNRQMTKKFFRDMILLKEKLLQGSSQWKTKIFTHKHKPQVLVHICYAGISITDQITGTVLVENEVQKISFVAGDMSDSRLCSIVCDAEGQYQIFNRENDHKVETLVINVKDLFQLIFSKREETCPKMKSNHHAGDMSLKMRKESVNKPKESFSGSSEPVLVKPPPFNANAGRRQKLLVSEQSTAGDLIDLWSSLPDDTPVFPQPHPFQTFDWFATERGNQHLIDM